MDQKKSKHPIVGAIIHYVIVVIVLAGVIVAYAFDKQIAEFFAKPLFIYDGLNQVWSFLPKIIHVIEIIGLIYVIVFLFDLLSKANIGLTYRSKTLLKVIFSLCKWIAIVGGIIWALYALGVDAAALLISAGVITLVIGLAAQSLISDVITGMLIVIEGKYLVDDIVVIDGYRGKVKAISLRTTSIEDIGGNVKVINNSEIKTIVNLTNHKSLAKVTIYVASSENLKNVEGIFEAALPEMKEKLSQYGVGDIIYKGMTTLDNNGMGLLYVTECYEEDIYNVERTLYREFKYIMDDKDISNNEPLVIHDRTAEFSKPNKK